MKEIENIIKDIKLFPKSVLAYKAGLTQKELLDLESILKVKLPEDFRYFYSQINGFSLMGEEVYPVLLDEKKDSLEEGLISINHREHFEVVNPMPDYFLPFSPNGRGDHYCIDLRGRTNTGNCRVVFWQWDYSYFNPEDIETTHENFTDWLRDLVDELKEEVTL